MLIRLLRHATLVMEINRKKLLIDPMLSPQDAMDPVPNCGNDIRIPMVELPLSPAELGKLLEETDAVVVTHLHRDHWDEAAQQLIPKDKPVFCQPGDEAAIRGHGFKQVQPVEATWEWNGITISRTGGQHGCGGIGQMMGKVSGFVFRYEDQSIYLAGDTIWCRDVAKALLEFKPDITIVNAGAARFLTGSAITMTPEDIVCVQEACPSTKIIAVHMDTVNHCLVTRTDLAEALSVQAPALEVLIPADGAEIKIA